LRKTLNRHPKGAKAEHDNHQSHHQILLYDGVYGQINIFPKEEAGEKPAGGEEQMSLF